MYTETVKICGINQNEIYKRLQSVVGRGVSFSVTEKYLDASILMSSEIPRAAFDIIKSETYNLFADEVYSAVDVTLQNLAVELLKMTSSTLAVAESLTAGEICSRIASVPGASSVFYEGVVCYNRASKTARLGVSKKTLADYGAVSRQTAFEMVKGISSHPPVTIGLATTGLAGPDGDEGKPVGLVYIGVGSGEFIPVFERRFSGGRNEIREAVVNTALFYLIRYLKGDILRLESRA